MYSEVQLNTFTQLGADNTTEEYLHAKRGQCFSPSIHVWQGRLLTSDTKWFWLTKSRLRDWRLRLRVTLGVGLNVFKNPLKMISSFPATLINLGTWFIWAQLDVPVLTSTRPPTGSTFDVYHWPAVSCDAPGLDATSSEIHVFQQKGLQRDLLFF